MKKWSFCGRVGVLAALTLSALAAANVAAADPGIGVASSVTAAAAPVTQSVPATPALPTPTVPAPAVPTAPAAPAVPAPVASVVAAVPHVAVPKVTLPHVSVGAKAKASVHVSKQHTITVKSSLTAHARVGKTHAKVSTSSKAKVSKTKVTGSRVLSATTTGPCPFDMQAGYNCVQISFDGPSFNRCDSAFVNLTGFVHDMAHVQNNLDGTVTIYHHFNYQQMKGFGSDGNPYTASDITKDYSETVPITLGLTFHVHTSHQERQVLVSLGPDPNQIMTITTTTDMDVDAAGNPLGAMPSMDMSQDWDCTG